MAEEPKEKENYQFIREEIVPKRKNKLLKRLGTAGFVVLMAIVFGLVAEIVMLTSEDVLREWLGIEEGERQTVDLNRPSPQPTKEPTSRPSPTNSPVPTNTPMPTPTNTAAPTKVPDATPNLTPEATETSSPVPTEEPDLTSEPTKEPQASPTPETTPGQEITPVPTEEAGLTPGDEITLMPTQGAETSVTPEPTQDPLAAYMQVHGQILSVAEEVSSSLVVIEAIEEGVDWFQEIYVTRTRTTGLILANDGIDLLILAEAERVLDANRVEVYFGDVMVAGRVYAWDKSYGLAVVAVPLSAIPTEVLKATSIGILAAEESILVGTPVLALGAPNGYEGSMEFGMITSLGSTLAVSDGQVSYFTTDMNDRENGYGFVVNLDGEILGMITHSLKENPEDDIFSVVSLQAVQGVIVKLLNNTEQAYLGIKGQDLPRSVMASSGLEAGVYVGEVENASPALNAGIKAGDIIVAVGEQPIAGIRELHERLLGCSAKDVISVKLMRRAEEGMKEVIVEVPLGVKN